MVDIFIDWQRHEFDLEGEKISMELKPLTTSGIFQLMKINLESPDEKQIEVLQKIFNESARNIENLTISGKPATIDDLVNISQLMGLSSNVMVKLTEISNLSKGDEKNLIRQSNSAPSKDPLIS